MATRAAIGRWGEDYTAEYLRQNGYRILHRNWHCRYGELDIIALRDGILAFVEVKTRAEHSMVSPEEAVSASKQKKLLLAAECYLLQSELEDQPRFDVAAVTVVTYPEISLVHFDYYECAFEGGES